MNTDVMDKSKIMNKQAVSEFAEVEDLLEEYNLSFTQKDYYLTVGTALVKQSWILHLSVIQTQFISLLNTILPTLAKENVAFKVAGNVDVTRNILDGRLGYANIGKVITIYPEDEQQVLQLATKLVALTKPFSGPNVRTDYYLGGVVFASYVISNSSINELPKDNNRIPFMLPIGLKWPFEQLVPYIQPMEKKLWKYKYHPLFLIKDDVKGRVIKGNYFKTFFNIQFCIIKEGVKNMWSDESGRDVVDRLHWQYELYSRLGGIIPIPKIFDLFEQDNNTYLVMEFIKGQSLHNKIAALYEGKSWFELLPSRKIKLLAYFSNILDVIEKLHENGYVHRDITPANFIISKRNTVYLIDMELTYSIVEKRPAPVFKHGTIGFMSPEQYEAKLPNIKEDIYALGALMILIFTGLSPSEVNKSSIKLQSLLTLLTEDQEICSLIIKCVDQDPAKRPEIAFIKKAIQRYRRELELTPSIVTNPTVRLKPNNEQLYVIINKAITGLNDRQMISREKIWKSRIRKNENPWISSTEYIIQPGVYNGLAGVLYLLARAKRVGFNTSTCMDGYNESWKYLCNNYLDNPTALEPGLYDGFAGIAMAIFEGIKSGMLPLDPYLNYLPKCFTSSMKNIDFANGHAGQITAFLHCSSQLDNSFAQTFLHPHIELLIKQQQKDGSWNIFRNPEEKIIGFSHGIAGIICSLVAYSHYKTDERVSMAIQRGVHWLTKVAHKTNGNPYWNTTTKSKSVDRWSSSIGIPGVLLALIKSYSIIKDPSIKRMAERVLHQLPKAPTINNLSQAFGLAGLGELYLEANKVFETDKWQNRIEWIVDLIMHSFSEDNEMAGHWYTNSESELEANLMTGISGIIHFLIRYHSPAQIGYILT
jgi:serine/threonine protein kinase